MLAQELQRPRASMMAFSTFKPALTQFLKLKNSINSFFFDTKLQFVQIINVRSDLFLGVRNQQSCLVVLFCGQNHFSQENPVPCRQQAVDI